MNNKEGDKEKKSEDDEDIHAKRFAETLKFESPELKESEVEEVKERKYQSKFTFNSSYNSLNISLDDVNIINIENE